MSYFMPTQGVGSMNRRPAMRNHAMHGFGAMTQANRPMYRRHPMYHSMSLYGLGASFAFNAASVWSDWSSSDPTSQASAAKSIQAALNAIGYGPLVVDGQFGDASVSAWTRFASDNGTGGSWPDQVGIDKLGEKLNVGGGNQGGGGVQDSHIVSGQFVPGAAPSGTGTSTAGMSMGMKIGIGAAALVAVIGLLALTSKKKPSGSTSSEPKSAPKPHTT